MPAADQLKQILADRTQFADNVVVTLATGQTVSLGDLRGLSTADQSAVAAREAAITLKQAELEKSYRTLQLAQQETARMFTELQADKDKLRLPAGPAAPDPLDALDSEFGRDPVLGKIVSPLTKLIRQQQTVINELTERQIKPIASSMSQMAKAYMDDQLDSRYQAMNIPADKQAEYTLDKLLAVANEQKFMTRGQMPDIRRAYQHLTTTPVTAADLQKQLTDAEEKGRKAGEQAAQEAARLRVPRPGFNSGAPQVGKPDGFKPKSTTSVSAAFDEAFAAAAKDASIWTSVDGALN